MPLGVQECLLRSDTETTPQRRSPFNAPPPAWAHLLSRALMNTAETQHRRVIMVLSMFLQNLFSMIACSHLRGRGLRPRYQVTEVDQNNFIDI